MPCSNPPSSGRRRRLAALLATATVGAAAPLLLGAAPAGAEVRPICFPVFDTPTQYYGNFGDPRDGGARTHEGEDIMGRPMQRVVAATDGVVLGGTDGIRWRGTGHTDHSIRMRGDDGYYYAYLHLNDDTPGTNDDLGTYDHAFGPGIAPGVRVRAGQLIGYLGDSGNAGEGNDHLHFEIRTPAARVWDAPAIDPYDSLQASSRCPLSTSVSSPTHPFTNWGGTARGDVDAVSPAGGRVEVFLRGVDDQLWTRSWDNGTFSAWTPSSGVLRSGPSVVWDGTSVRVFVRGQDDALWTRARTGGTWSGWESLGGSINADPDAGSAGDGTVTVVARGLDQGLWERTFDGTTWSPWTSLGGNLRSGPSLAVGDDGTHLYARGTDDGLWTRLRVDGTWGPWTGLGGYVNADPDAAATDGEVYVVVRSSGDRLWCLPRAAGAWQPVSTGAVGSGPGMASWGPGRLDLYVAATDGTVYQTWWTGAGW